MSQKFRVVIHVSGGGGSGENVLWEGTLEELRAKYVDNPETSPIESSEAARHYVIWKHVQRESKDGWEQCTDPRKC